MAYKIREVAVELKYYTVNAFTDTAFEGTQVLVFPEANDIDSDTMHKIAREFAFPDTVFITPARSQDCQAKFRLFTKNGETNFEGHATIAAAYVFNKHNDLISRQSKQTILVEEGSEKIEIGFDVDENNKLVTEFVVDVMPSFDSYAPSYEELGQIFSLDPKAFKLDGYRPLVSSCKKTYLIIPVRNPEDLQQARFSSAAWRGASSTSTLPYQLLVFSPVQNDGNKREFYARLMGETVALDEDPPIGSAMPAFANYLLRSDLRVTKFVVKRGVGHERLSTLNIQIDALQEGAPIVRVGGNVTDISAGILCF